MLTPQPPSTWTLSEVDAATYSCKTARLSVSPLQHEAYELVAHLAARTLISCKPPENHGEGEGEVVVFRA